MLKIIFLKLTILACFDMLNRYLFLKYIIFWIIWGLQRLFLLTLLLHLGIQQYNYHAIITESRHFRIMFSREECKNSQKVMNWRNMKSILVKFLNILQM
jgi:hypothetical protein